MEPGCTPEDFGRPVQPAASNRLRCWAVKGGVWTIFVIGEKLCGRVVLSVYGIVRCGFRVCFLIGVIDRSFSESL